MPPGISRRQLMTKMLLAGALLPTLDCVARETPPQSLTPLEPKDSAANALGFVTDAASASSNPVFKKGQHCATCVHYLGQPSDTLAACNIYAGHSVPANGWCIVWSIRSG